MARNPNSLDLGVSEFKLTGCFCKPRPSFEAVARVLREVVDGPISLVLVDSNAVAISVFCVENFACLCSSRFLLVEGCFLEILPVCGEGLASSLVARVCEQPLVLADEASGLNWQRSERGSSSRFVSRVVFRCFVEPLLDSVELVFGSIACDVSSSGSIDVGDRDFTTRSFPCLRFLCFDDYVSDSATFVVGSLACGVCGRGPVVDGELITPEAPHLSAPTSEWEDDFGLHEVSVLVSEVGLVVPFVVEGLAPSFGWAEPFSFKDDGLMVLLSFFPNVAFRDRLFWIFRSWSVLYEVALPCCGLVCFDALMAMASARLVFLIGYGFGSICHALGGLALDFSTSLVAFRADGAFLGLIMVLAPIDRGYGSMKSCGDYVLYFSASKAHKLI